MDDDSCGKFIGSLTKYLQSLCHSYVDFNNGVELVGHIFLHVDTGKKIDYVLNESVCKNGSNVVKFTSNSYHASPADKKDKEEPPKKAPDPSKSGLEGGKKRSDDDVIILGSEASRRRRSMSNASQSQQPPASSASHMQSRTGPTQPTTVPSSSGMFRHPRGPNPRMAGPMSGPRVGPYPYQPRRRLPGPPQTRSYLPMGAPGYNPRLRQPPYQSQGVPPAGGRGSFPVPSDIASIRGQYPQAPGQAMMGSRATEPGFRHPFPPPPHQPASLTMQQGLHMQRPLGPHSSLPHLQGTHLQPSLGPQGPHLHAPRGPHASRFMPPYSLSSHSPRTGMSLPVNTQPSPAVHPVSTSASSAAPPKPVPSAAGPPSNSAPSCAMASSASSSSAPPPNTVMIKGRPVPIPDCLVSTGQPKTSAHDSVSKSSSSVASCHPSALPGGSSKPITTNTNCSSGSSMSSSQDVKMHRSELAKLSALARSSSADPLERAMSASGVSSAQSLVGISMKGRPSTPVFEQCAAKSAAMSPRVSGSHFPFPPVSSGSSTSPRGGGGGGGGQFQFPATSAGSPHMNSGSFPFSTGNSAVSPRSGGPFQFPPGGSHPPGTPARDSSHPPVSNSHTAVSLKTQQKSPAYDAYGSKSMMSPREGGVSQIPFTSISDTSFAPGGAGGHPFPALAGSLPPFPSNSSGSHPAGSSSLQSPRASDRNNPFSDLNMGALSHPSSNHFHSPRVGDGSMLHSPRVDNRNFPYLSSSASNFQSPFFDRSHGQSNSTHPSPMGSNVHSPRVSDRSLPFAGSDSLSHPGSGSNLHSPRVIDGGHVYMGSANGSYPSSAASSLYSPHAKDRNLTFSDVSGVNLSHPSPYNSVQSPRTGERSHPYIGSSNVSHPSMNRSSMISPRSGDRSFPNLPNSGSNNRTLSFSSSPGSVSNVSFPSLTHSDPFPSAGSNTAPFSSVGGSHVSFPSLSESDIAFPPTTDTTDPYSSVHSDRVPFPLANGSSLPYPTFGDINLPFPPLNVGNLTLPPLPPLDVSTDATLNSQLNPTPSGSTRHSEPLFDMYSQQSQPDLLQTKFSEPPQTNPLDMKAQASDASPSLPFPPNLPHPSAFGLEQAGPDGDGFNDLVSELQALSHPTADPAAHNADHLDHPEGMDLPEDRYPEDGDNLDTHSRPSHYDPDHDAPVDPRTLEYDDGGDGSHLQPRAVDYDDAGVPMDDRTPHYEASHYDAESCQADSGQDNVSPETSGSGSQGSTGDGTETFLAPYEIGPAGGSHAASEEYRKRSGSMSSHSHETPSPSPGHEGMAPETKPPGHQASDYDSGCDSASTSTGERLSSPPGQPQSATHPPLKSLTIPLVPVDSPSSLARGLLKQDQAIEDEAGLLPDAQSQSLPVVEKETEWLPDPAAFNNSDSTESYSENDDPDYVPDRPREKGPVKRGRSKKSSERANTRAKKKRKEDTEDKCVGEVGEEQTSLTITTEAEVHAQPPDLPPPTPQTPQVEGEEDRYDPGMFLLVNTATSEVDRNGRVKTTQVPAEVISLPEGETEGLWVHTLVPAGNGLWRLPPDNTKSEMKTERENIIKPLYKVTVKIVAGKVLYRFDDM